MKNKKLVSIVIPVYNNEEYLNHLFKTLLNQTIGFENMEIILINDGSTDNTKKMLKDFASSYENVLFLSNIENKGAAYTRNRGIDFCTTDYIIFMDADDPYKEDFVEVYYNTIKKYNVDIVKSNIVLNFKSEEMKFSFEDDMRIAKNFYDFPIFFILKRGNGIYNLNFLNENRICFDEEIKKSEDTLFNLECFIKSKKEKIFLLNYYALTWCPKFEYKLNPKYLYNITEKLYLRLFDLLIEYNIPIEYIYKIFDFDLIIQLLRLLNNTYSKEETIEILNNILMDNALNITSGVKKYDIIDTSFLY